MPRSTAVSSDEFVEIMITKDGIEKIIKRMWNIKGNRKLCWGWKTEKNEEKKKSEEEELVSDAVLVSRREKQQFYEVLR